MIDSIYKTTNSRGELTGFEDSVMAMWPYPYEARSISTCAGETHVVTAGDQAKPALVLLHGAASNLLTFGGDIPRYMGDYFVVAVDIVGEAGKSAPLRPSWNDDAYVRWLSDVFDGLRLEKAALFGQSLGGWIAAKFAAQKPQRVEKLILLSPAGIVSARASFVFKSIAYSLQKKKGLEKMKRLVFGADEIPDMVSAFFNLIQAHYVPRFGSPPKLSDAELVAITAPVLMIFGENDAFFPAKKAVRRLLQVKADARVHTIGQGQHGILDSSILVGEFLKS